jgi:hypothetical protein
MADQLTVFEFGRQLLRTMDLDPVYVLLWDANMQHEKLCDWLIAYLCFYHCGTACWIVGHGPSSKDGYWNALLAAASTKEHPRSSERRHFRGEQAIKAVQELRSRRLTCYQLVTQLTGRKPTQALSSLDTPSLAEVVSRVKELRGFGDWVAFKVADILERLALCSVQFKPTDVFHMYEAPRKGAEAMVERHGPARGNYYLWAYNQLIRHLGHLQAPPRFERTINIQEIETILCKWKSHLNGHYEVGKDINEIHHGLQKYHYCATAHRLLLVGKGRGFWK